MIGSCLRNSNVSTGLYHNERTVFMAKKVHLKKWKIKGDKVKLTYGFLSSFYVSKKDFDRAFGPIVSGERDEIKRDFALNRKKAAVR